MFRMLMVFLGKMDSTKHEKIAIFFMLLGEFEARLINYSPWLYARLEFILFGGLDPFATKLMSKIVSDDIFMCGEIRLYVICPYLWQKFRDKGIRKGYRYVNLDKVEAVNDLPC